MKAMKAAIILLVATVLILGIPQVMLAGRTGTEPTSTGGPITTHPTATGSTFPGVLAVSYDRGCSAACLPEVGPDAKMTSFMRLEVGNNLYSFGSVTCCVCYWDFRAQQAAIESFFKRKVIPFLYQQGAIKRADACFALKSATKVVDDMEGNFFDVAKPVFTLMDFVIAIDDTTSCP